MARKKGDNQTEKNNFSEPAKLKWPYNSVQSERIDQRSKASVSEAHLVENKRTSERFIRLINRFRKPYKKEISIGQGFNIYRGDALSRLIDIFRKFANLLGWKTSALSNESIEAQSEKILEELQKKDSEILELKKELEQRNNERLTFIESIKKKHEEEIAILKSDPTRLQKLDAELDEFKQLIADFETQKKTEEDIQKFLKDKKWFFGMTVVIAKPKIRAGATAIFDYVLTYTDGSQRVVELKLPTEKIVDAEGKISAAVAKGLDQLIEYLEQTVAVAHSQLPEAEYLKDKKPRGTLLIGRTTDAVVDEKIKSWNYALHFVEIKTYDQVIADAETALKQLKGE
jgi:hypothetical protein